MNQYISQLPLAWQNGWRFIAVCRARGLMSLSNMHRNYPNNQSKVRLYYRRAAEMILYAPEN